MKRVLLISYYFPPCGLGGVQRAAKLAKYLPKFGWNVTVLTVKEISYYNKDYTLLEELESVQIERTGSLDPLRLTRLLFGKRDNNRPSEKSKSPGKLSALFRFIDRKLFIPDSKVLWNTFAYFRAVRMLKNTEYDAIISTAPPFSSHLLALKLARRFKIPWIADFRDGWMNKDLMPPTGKLNKRIQSAQERKTVHCADKIICISGRIKNHLDTIDSAENKKSVLIYNGFDLEDFNVRAAGGDKFSLLYMGTVTEWTDPSVLFDSIAYALKKEPELEKQLKINIVGSVMNDSFYKRIKDRDLDKYVNISGYKSHKDAIAELVYSNILLFAITIYDTPGVITGKIFEYLASGNPVLAHAREGEARQILSNYCQEVFFHDPEKPDEASDFIIDQFYAWKQNNNRDSESGRKSIDIEKLKIFSREHQAEQIANILDSLSEKAVKQ